MGGYEHSRLQERILGGVTCEIPRCMTVPTLMSHYKLNGAPGTRRPLSALRIEN
jgi:hypothetical protein